MPRKKKPKSEESKSEVVTQLLETGLLKPASDLEAPVADLPPPDRETVPYGPRGPRRSDEPTPLGDVLANSPVAQMIANQEPASSMEEVAAEALVEIQKPTHVQRLTGLRPAPKGFVGLEGHYAAGIRLSRSLDKNVVAIQFADDQKPTRDGLNPENERLRDRGFLYVPMRSQWERVDRQQPAENYQDAKEFVSGLARERLSGQGTGAGRA
jgi:hypothetical protein